MELVRSGDKRSSQGDVYKLGNPGLGMHLLLGSGRLVLAAAQRLPVVGSQVGRLTSQSRLPELLRTDLTDRISVYDQNSSVYADLGSKDELAEVLGRADDAKITLLALDVGSPGQVVPNLPNTDPLFKIDHELSGAVGVVGLLAEDDRLATELMLQKIAEEATDPKS